MIYFSNNAREFETQTIYGMDWAGEESEADEMEESISDRVGRFESLYLHDSDSARAWSYVCRLCGASTNCRNAVAQCCHCGGDPERAALIE